MKIHSFEAAACVCAGLLFVVILPGCGNSKPTGSLKGKISYKGDAVPDAKIQVQLVEIGTAATGISDASGNYKIEAPLVTGKYKAFVIPAEEPPPPEPGAPPFVPKDNPKIPQKYRSVTTSGLAFEIKLGDNQFNVDMQD